MEKIKNTYDPQIPGALDGVNVLDLTGVIAGSYCTRLMADLGANVLKVEPPDGEIMRDIAPMRGSTSTVFSALNAGKKCISIDLKKSDACSIVYQLIKKYDVIVENFSPGVMARLNIDYETLKGYNRNIVMCSISGYGQSGPGAKRPAYAPIVQAMTGFEMVTLDAQNALERPLNMGLPVGDTTAALQAFGALTAALYYREKYGKGQYIDIAMSDSILATMHRDFQTAFHDDPIERRYGPTKTKDGFIIIMPLSQRHYTNLMECIGQSALIADPRFADTRSRLDNYNELLRLAEVWAKDLLSAAALVELEKLHVPCAPYRSLADAATDPQLEFRKMITEVIDEAGPLEVVNSPFSFSETQAAVRSRVAILAEDTYNILAQELEFPDEKIRSLEEAKIIYCGSKK